MYTELNWNPLKSEAINLMLFYDLLGTFFVKNNKEDPEHRPA